MAIPDFSAHGIAAKYAVLVDVGYLYAAAGEVLLGAKERKEYRVAADELIQSLQKHAVDRISGELLRVYWYDAARDRVPTVDQRVIAQLPWVKVRLGNLNARGQQKGVDAQIRSDLEALARHHAVNDTVLIAGDEDMVPAVEAAQAYGVRVHLWGVEPPFGTNQAERLVWESDTVEILSADFLRPFFTRAPVPVPVTPAPSPAQVFAGRAKPMPPKTPVGQTSKLGPGRPHVEEVGEHVAQKWILTRGRDNIRDLLPGPILPTVIDTELLIEAEKELGHSLRPYPEARVWLRDGFWARVYREFDLGVGISSK
ncbi:NYN domain-containing protein [Microbispora sp. H10670]|uniref:NYN domain-containing protein n=3 Tax=Microbispora TaxID=2005 RepID=A0ABY3M3Z2_9ACTN|nr:MULTISPECIES: NYN domain-containing protein [Microbispora]TLP62175.1 NYN domain-containing protein [Microbispora fusca]TYB66283.1 NYN domain-containing protein [Microbispora tritici]GLW21926.1 NYN domain-containing protein [Microbispora amethystogenes]MBO4271503.1 NYN domain-containing protein [Microbispora triticiradicis]RGA05894.1 NYN domain-containing protein [Microbispora triticiradicis]